MLTSLNFLFCKKKNMFIINFIIVHDVAQTLYHPDHCCFDWYHLLCLYWQLANNGHCYEEILSAGVHRHQKCLHQKTITERVGITSSTRPYHWTIIRSRMHYYAYADILEKETSWKVPALIHFIWLGKSLPSKYVENIKRENYIGLTSPLRWFYISR